jgi:hypothetical protein
LALGGTLLLILGGPELLFILLFTVARVVVLIRRVRLRKFLAQACAVVGDLVAGDLVTGRVVTDFLSSQTSFELGCFCFAS